MTSRSVSITGATGFLGWHLCGAFRDAGWTVRGIVRPGNRKPLPEHISAVEAPLDPQPLADAVAGSSLLIHSAAVVRAATEAEIRRVNVGGTRAAVAAANASGARLLLISSQAAIGPSSTEHPSREDDVPHPITEYGRSKVAAEAVVHAEARTAWTIVRPSAVYGPRDRGFLPLFRLASHGIFLMAADAATPFSFVHVDDLVRALVLAATDDRADGPDVFPRHIQSRDAAADLLRSLAAAFGNPYRPIRVPARLIQLAGAVGDVCWRLGLTPTLDSDRASEMRAIGFVCSADRAREMLGFTALRPLPDGVEQTARWYRDRGWV